MLLIPKMQPSQQPFPGQGISLQQPFINPRLQNIPAQKVNTMPRFSAASAHSNGNAQADGKCDGLFRSGKAIALVAAGLLSAAYLFFKKLICKPPAPPRVEAQAPDVQDDIYERLNRLEQGRSDSPEAIKPEGVQMAVQPSASPAEPVEQIVQLAGVEQKESAEPKRRPSLRIDTRPEALQPRFLRPRLVSPTTLSVPALSPVPEAVEEPGSGSDNEDDWVMIEEGKQKRD